MQAYSSTLLQFIFKFQLVYFPYFYDDKVQKKCTNLVHSCNQMVHSYFARYSPNRKILAKNARYLPFLSDICLYLPKSHNWGGMIHDGGIFGYNQEDKTFCLYAYDSDWIYKKFWTSQSSFMNGILAAFKQGKCGNLYGLKPNTMQTIDFSAEIALNQI